jgi:Tfp pilus assembly protein PilV
MEGLLKMNAQNRPGFSKQNRSRQCGSTVLEALIAFCVLAVSGLAVMHLQTDLRHHAALSQQRLQASRLAQQQIENWRAKPNLAAGEITQITLQTYKDSASQYTIKRQVTQLPITTLVNVSVDIQWKDDRQQPQHWRIHSLQSTANAVYSGALALQRSLIPMH